MPRRITWIALVAAATALLASAASARPAAAPTLSVSTKVVGFGAGVTLRGTVAGADAGQEVQILTQACGFTAPVPIGTTTTTAGGRYAYTAEPMLNSAFVVQANGEQSAPAPVRVRPTVQLRRIARGTFGVDVSAGNGSWFTKAVTLQRYDTRAKRWKSVASARLKANSDPGAIVSVSSATVRAAAKAGTRVRAVVRQATVGACYLPASSPALSA